MLSKTTVSVVLDPALVRVWLGAEPTDEYTNEDVIAYILTNSLPWKIEHTWTDELTGVQETRPGRGR